LRRCNISDEIYTISDLDQVRVLADPFRLKLLGAFGNRPRTTKQVAQELGEKPTKLYHHVEALKRLGLLVLTGTHPNRGTVEKYYQAVATRFRVGATLFSPHETADPMADETSAMLMSILDTTRAELADLVSQSTGCPETRPASSAMVARMLLHGQPKQIERFRARLLALLEQFKTETAGLSGDKKADSYGLTLAFYPVPSPAAGGKQREPDDPAPAQSRTSRRGPARPRTSRGGNKSANKN
jgi:hypothetical protein